MENDRANFNPDNEGETLSLVLGDTPGKASLFFENGNEKWLPLKSEPVGPPVDAKQLVGTWVLDPDRSAKAWETEQRALLREIAPDEHWNDDAMLHLVREQLQKEAANPANVIKFVAGSGGGAETYVGLGADFGADEPQHCEIWEDGVILHRPSAKSRDLQGRYLVFRDGYLVTDFGVGPRLFRKQP